MSVRPPPRPRPAARWAGSLAVVTAAHVAVGTAWLAHVPLAPLDPPAAVLVDLAPLPEPQQPEPEPPKPDPPPPDPAPPEPPPPEPPPPDLPPPDEPPPVAMPPPKLPDIPPPDEPPPVEPPPPEPPKPPPPKPPPPRPPPRPRPVPHPDVSPPQAAVAPAPAAPPPAPAPRAVAVPTSWSARLFAQLARHKRYPAEAQQRRQEGTPLVRITMDHGGRVLAARLERSSGFPLLDAEALALVPRAEPLPPLPDDVTASTIEVVVPVSFRIR